MLETRPFQSYDLRWLELTTPTGWVDTSTMHDIVDPHLSISLFEDGMYRGSAGVYRVWHGVYEAWLMLLSMPTDLRGFLKALQRGIAQAFELTQAHRIQGYCLASFTKGIKLAKRLGFRQEGVLRHGAPDRSDMILFAMVPSWA